MYVLQYFRYPLKQGLRLFANFEVNPKNLVFSLSIKTRIKTKVLSL